MCKNFLYYLLNSSINLKLKNVYQKKFLWVDATLSHYSKQGKLQEIRSLSGLQGLLEKNRTHFR